jgi:S-DNA-T family DNA segregation ATPase FtsK/SpoIIIE
MPRKAPSHHWNEVIGLILLICGTLLFFSLVSYTPRDVPDWFPLSSTSSSSRHTTQNFIGPVGALLACTLYFFLGAASYLFTAVLLGCGAAKLITGTPQLRPRIVWMAAFILSGACLLQWQPWLLRAWPHEMNTRGPGGFIGFWLGREVFGHLVGWLGSGILLGGVYFISLIYLTGVHPIRLLRLALAQPRLWLEKYRAAQLARADERERLALEEKRLAREARKLEKKLGKKNVPAFAPSVEEEEELPVNRPAPQIIDTAMVPAKPTEKKLALAEPAHFDNYQLPDLDLLDPIDETAREAADPEELLALQRTIIETLAEFGISVSPGDITKGPVITRYEVYPAKGVRVAVILNAERDLARATRAERINILAPIPGKDTVGIEIPNRKKTKVTFRELLEADEWTTTKATIPLALGKDVYGKTIIADLAKMPHLLVAGTTGSGKSVCINAIIASILYRFSPDDIRLVMIDPKVVEMQIYNTLPHLVVPVVTDPKKVLLALRWVVDEMDKRYDIFAKVGVRNIAGFNERPKAKTQAELDAEKLGKSAAKAALAATPVEAPKEINFDDMDDDALFEVEAQKPKITVPRDADEIIIPEGNMPYIVVIVDELADLMQTAPADVESAIARLTQKARAAGIHVIVATQTPRAQVITGVIKANIPSRIAFQVASPLDSRVILDENGAEKLLGQGDMLYLPPGTSRMTRAQGVLVTDEEIKQVVDFCSAQSEPAFVNEIHEKLQSGGGTEEPVNEEDEELVQKCIEIMRQEKKASTSLFQRRLRLGYTRAARVVDILEQRGYVAPGDGAKPREILVNLDSLVH